MQSYNEKLKKLEMKYPNDITEPVLSFCKNISNESPFFIKKAEERAQLLMPYGNLDSSNELKFKKIQEEIAELSRAILNILD